MRIEITEEELKNLKEVRNYFGEHDKTLFEHKAYAVLDGLIKNIFESKTNKIMKKYSLTKEEGVELLNKTLPYPQHIEKIDLSKSGSIYFTWMHQRYKLCLVFCRVERSDGCILTGDSTSVLMTEMLRNKLGETESESMSKSDEKLLKDIMNAVEKQDHLDASIGKSVRELAEQGYKVIVEKNPTIVDIKDTKRNGMKRGLFGGNALLLILYQPSSDVPTADSTLITLIT